MLSDSVDRSQGSRIEGLFRMQVALGSLSVVLLLYILLAGNPSASGTRAVLPLVEYLSVLSLLVLLLRVLWRLPESWDWGCGAAPTRRAVPVPRPARLAWRGFSDAP